MTLWTYNRPPALPNPKGSSKFLDRRGWVLRYADGREEVIVAMRNDASDSGASDIIKVEFEKDEYAQGDALKVIVSFNEEISVVAGMTIEVAWTGISGNFVATAAAQTSVHQVEFDAVVPSEPGILGIAAQTLSGSASDDQDALPSGLSVSAEVADAVGNITVS